MFNKKIYRNFKDNLSTFRKICVFAFWFTLSLIFILEYRYSFLFNLTIDALNNGINVISPDRKRKFHTAAVWFKVSITDKSTKELCAVLKSLLDHKLRVEHLAAIYFSVTKLYFHELIKALVILLISWLNEHSYLLLVLSLITSNFAFYALLRLFRVPTAGYIEFSIVFSTAPFLLFWLFIMGAGLPYILLSIYILVRTVSFIYYLGSYVDEVKHLRRVGFIKKSVSDVLMRTLSWSIYMAVLYVYLEFVKSDFFADVYTFLQTEYPNYFWFTWLGIFTLDIVISGHKFYKAERAFIHKVGDPTKCYKYFIEEEKIRILKIITMYSLCWAIMFCFVWWEPYVNVSYPQLTELRYLLFFIPIVLLPIIIFNICILMGVWKPKTVSLCTFYFLATLFYIFTILTNRMWISFLFINVIFLTTYWLHFFIDDDIYVSEFIYPFILLNVILWIGVDFFIILYGYQTSINNEVHQYLYSITLSWPTSLVTPCETILTLYIIIYTALALSIVEANWLFGLKLIYNSRKDIPQK